MSDSNPKAAKKRKAIIKDSELGFSIYDFNCGEWLRDNYGEIAERLFDRHVVEGKANSYKSKRIKSIANDCASIYYGKPRTLVIPKIRIALQDKNKKNTKFTVRELEDFCDLRNTTANEIIGIPTNAAHSIVVLSETDIQYILKNFDKFRNEDGKYRVPCLCFPLLGVISYAIFKGGHYLDDLLSVHSKHRSVSVEFQTVSLGGDTELSTTYAAMKSQFFLKVAEVAQSQHIDRLCEITTIEPLIKRFFESEFRIGEAKTHKHTRSLQVNVPDNPAL